MNAAEFFVFPRTILRMYAGPLGRFIDTFADQLQQRGYSRQSIRDKIRTAANFSHWLECHDLDADDVNADQLKRYLRHRKRIGRCTRNDPATLWQISAVVCDQDLTHASDSLKTLSDRDRVVEDFKKLSIARPWPIDKNRSDVPAVYFPFS